jgi:hypothetical protein
MMVLIALNIYLFLSITLINQRLVQYDKDNNFLDKKLIECYSTLSGYDTSCKKPEDCLNNSSLQGCEKLDCNWCCGSSCTLMACSDNEVYDIWIPVKDITQIYKNTLNPEYGLNKLFQNTSMTYHID